MTHYYGMRLRGCAPMCQPRGFTRLDDTTGCYHDLLAYDHRLTDEETAAYELDYLGTELYNSNISTSVNEEDTRMPVRESWTKEQRHREGVRQAAWDASNTRSVKMKLNNRTDADIIAHLDSLDNVQGYIKSLIRADIAAHKKEEE